MKKLILSILFFSLFISAFSQCVIDYSNLSVSPDFSDDFSGTQLDGTKWTVIGNTGFNCASTYDDYVNSTAAANVFLDSGNLKLRAIPNGGVPYCGGKTSVRYTSGAIMSKQPYLYGYFETRCKMTVGSGSWPAFWLFNSNGDEIDVFEFLGEDPNDFTNNVIDWPNASINNLPKHDCQNKYRYNRICNDLTTDFHTYGVAWTPSAITFFFDGKEIRTVDVTNFFNQKCSGDPYNICPLYITFDLAMETWANGQSSTFIVDYVRKYSINNLSLPIKKEFISNNNLPLSSIPMHSNIKSASFGENDAVFFKDPNGWVAVAYYSNGWNLAYLTTTWSQTEVAEGDVVVGEDNDVFFTGILDHKLHRYHWNGSAWVHDIPGSTSTITVSSSPGSISVGKCNQVFVKDPNGWLAVYYKVNGVYTCAYLTTTWNNQTEPASGDITAMANNAAYSGNGVCYRSTNGKLSWYSWTPTSGWVFGQSPSTLSTSNVSSQPGSIWVSVQPTFDNNSIRTVIFYRGQDNWIQAGWWDANGWNNPYLTNTWNATTEAVGGCITGSEDHVFYIGTDGKLRQYAWSAFTSGNGWTAQNLNIPVQGNLISREFNNILFYRGTDGLLHDYFWRTCDDLHKKPDGTNICSSPVSLRSASYRGNGVTSSMANSGLYEIEIFPNPANDKMNISVKGDQSIFNKLEIMDVSGKVIQEYAINSESLEVSIQDLPSGLYFAKFGGLDKVEMRKVVKQ